MNLTNVHQFFFGFVGSFGKSYLKITSQLHFRSTMSSILWIAILFLMCSNTLCAPQNAKKMRVNDEKEAGMIDENMTADDTNMQSPPIIDSTSSTEIAGSNMSFVSPASSPNFEETP